MIYISEYEDFILETNNFNKGNAIMVHNISDLEVETLQGKIIETIYRENCKNEEEYDIKCDIATREADYGGEFITASHIVWVAIEIDYSKAIKKTTTEKLFLRIMTNPRRQYC